MKWLWWGVIALSAVALAGAWGLWSKWCNDSAGGVGYCESAPAVTWEGAAIITAAALGALILAATKLRRLKDPNRTPTWTVH